VTWVQLVEIYQPDKWRQMGGEEMTLLAQLTSLLFIIFAIYFLVSVLIFIKRKTKNDEVLILRLEGSRVEMMLPPKGQ